MYTIKHYPKDASYHQTFEDVRLFLRKHNDSLRYIHFHWSRWEWMFARASFDLDHLSKIILIEKDKGLKALLTFEDEPGVLFLVYEDELDLKQFLMDFIVTHHINDDLIIPNDPEMKTLMLNHGYEQLDWIDPVTRFSLDDFQIKANPKYDIVTLEEDYRLEEIHTVLWRGFNHEGDADITPETLSGRKHITSSPMFKKRYTFVAKYENHFVSYVGIWYEKNTKSALIEPVATVPEHRRQGLAKSLIYHAIKAVQADGATDIFVGSNGPTYINIGFKPFDEAYRYKKIKK